MESRYQQLRDGIAGLERTGVPLVWYDGSAYRPSGFSDDVGLYYFVPQLAVRFDLDVDQAVTVFLGGIVVVSLIVGVAGAWFQFRSRISRGLAALALVTIAALSILLGDIYVVQSSIVIAVLPPFVALASRHRVCGRFLAFALFAGLALGTAQYLRSHAATPVLVFTAIWVGFGLRDRPSRKVLLAGALCAGLLVPSLFFRAALDRRNDFLAEHVSGYRPVEEQHPFWHSVYVGFGYVQNPYGIAYDDAVAAAKVASIDPDAAYVSPEYERILRSEVIRFVIEHPLFAASALFAKLGVVLLYLLVFANVGLVAALWRPKPWWMELAYLSGLSVAALPLILVIPAPGYALGFIALAALYGLASLDAAWPA